MKLGQISPLDSGCVSSPAGFQAGAGTGGLKASGKPDVSLVVSDRPCAAAGVFTTNRVVAAPVLLDRETLAAGADIRAVVTNSGCANACTGTGGMAAARAMQALTARALGCAANQVLVMSTGVIGVPLDVEKVRLGVTAALSTLSAEGGHAAAQAIMTTDTRPKSAAVQVQLSAGIVTVGGMAKGAGMIAPNMATMLSVLTTDAALDSALCAELLHEAVTVSFNRIVVDGDMSTNDTVLLLANGASGVAVRDATDRAALLTALQTVATTLAQAIVRDGEGASKFITLVVTGAPDDASAAQVAHTIATSPLVKTAFAGGDPNWGRILAAAGRAGVEFDPEQTSLTILSAHHPALTLVAAGQPTAYAESAAAAIFAEYEIAVHLTLGSGPGHATVWTCDLTHDYITINADYRT